MFLGNMLGRRQELILAAVIYGKCSLRKCVMGYVRDS
jgi:hypothetical protein